MTNVWPIYQMFDQDTLNRQTSHFHSWKHCADQCGLGCFIGREGFHVINWTLLICECTLFFCSAPFLRQSRRGILFPFYRELVRGKSLQTFDTITVPSPLHLRPHGGIQAPLSGPKIWALRHQMQASSHTLRSAWTRGGFAFSHTSLPGWRKPWPEEGGRRG